MSSFGASNNVSLNTLSNKDSNHRWSKKWLLPCPSRWPHLRLYEMRLTAVWWSATLIRIGYDFWHFCCQGTLEQVDLHESNIWHFCKIQIHGMNYMYGEFYCSLKIHLFNTMFWLSSLYFEAWFYNDEKIYMNLCISYNNKPEQNGWQFSGHIFGCPFNIGVFWYDC